MKTEIYNDDIFQNMEYAYILGGKKRWDNKEYSHMIRVSKTSPEGARKFNSENPLTSRIGFYSHPTKMCVERILYAVFERRSFCDGDWHDIERLVQRLSVNDQLLLVELKPFFTKMTSTDGFIVDYYHPEMEEVSLEGHPLSKFGNLFTFKDPVSYILINSGRNTLEFEGLNIDEFFRDLEKEMLT
ncbi:MAG: hypothetical protein ABIE22_02940 [archaeon]